MPDPKFSKVPEISITEEDVSPIKGNAADDFGYYSQGSNVEGTDSQYIDKPSIFLTNEDVSDIKGRNQGYIDTTANALGTFGLKTIGTTIEGVGYLAGTVNGLAKVLDPTYDTKVSDFTDNPIREFGTEMNEWVDKLMPNYESTDEKENPTALRNLLGSVGNTTLRDAAPFMASAIIQGYGLGKIFQTPAQIARLTQIAEQGGELASQASMLTNLLKKAPPQAIQLLVNNGEAMLEAQHTSNEIYDDVYKKEIAKHGNEETANEVAELAKTEAFKNTWILNMAILKINNLETRGLFKSSLFSRRPLKELAKEWSTLSSGVDKAKWIAQKGWKYLDDPIKESAEELLQGGASTAIKDRITEQGADSKLSSSELFDSAANTLVGAVKRLGTDEGKLEVLSSMILAGSMNAYQRNKTKENERTNYLKRKEVYDSSIKSNYENIEGLTEDITDSTGVVKTQLTDKAKELLSQARTYNDFENLKNAAIVTNDENLYQIVKDTQLANLAFGHFEMGLGETLEQKISELSRETAEELKAQGKNTIEDFATGKNISIEEYTAKIKEKIKAYENVYNILEGQYNLPNAEIRQAAFTNGVLQTELKQKINSAKPIIGNTWLNYRTSINPNILTTDVIKNLNEELKSLEGNLEPQAINRSIEINGLLADYKALEDFNNTATDIDINNNYKNYKDTKSNKLYYEALKEQFKILTDPKANKEYFDKKAKENEESLPTTTNSDITLTPTTQQTPVVENKPKEKSKVNNQPIIDILNKNRKEDIAKISPTPDVRGEWFTVVADANDRNITTIRGKSVEEVRKLVDEFYDKQIANLNNDTKSDPNLEDTTVTPEEDFISGLDISNFQETIDLATNFTEDVTSPTIDLDPNITDDSIPNPKTESKKDSNIESINNNIDKKETEAKRIKNSIPLYITNRFEKQLGNTIPVDIKTGETELVNQEALRLLLELKQGDLVDVEVGFYYLSNKPDGDFLTYNEALNSGKEVSPKTLTIRSYKNGIKLGAIKNNSEEDIQDIFNNISSNTSLQNNILQTQLPVNSKWSGFIRSLANKNLPKNYTEVPFEDRAYLNTPSEVVGSKDFIVLTVNSSGQLRLPNYNKTSLTKALANLGLKHKSDLVSKVAVGYLRPGVMYTLLKSSDGKIIPLASHGEYITPENAKYVVDEITKASKDKKYDIKELKQKISPFIYYDRTKGFYLEAGKIKYKGEDITLQKMKELIQDRNVYKPIDLDKYTNNKQLDGLLKLNVPKSTSIQFINPKITLDLSTLKSKSTIIQEDIEAESSSTNISTTNDNIENYTNSELNIEDFVSTTDETIPTEINSEFDNISDEDVSKFTQDTSTNVSLSSLDEIANEQDLKDYLKRYKKSAKDLPKDFKASNYTIRELDQKIKCL